MSESVSSKEVCLEAQEEAQEDAPALTAVSSGIGVQSTTIAVLIREGVLPKPDVAIFSDTGWEPRRVYEHLPRVQAIFEEAGVEFVVVGDRDIRAENIEPGRFSSMPLFSRTKPGGKVSMGQRQCTNQYKLRPIYREIRKRLGAKAPNYRRAPKGRVAELWIGFSTDESTRIGGNHVKYVRQEHPLLDLRWSRSDCRDYLAEHGLGDTPKSACVGCPFHGNRQWRDMRENHPAEWADAVMFDRAIRNARPGIEQFLHRSGTPLETADLRSPAQVAAESGQQAFWDLDEDGDPDGCGPFSCRSGVPLPLPRVRVAS